MTLHHCRILYACATVMILGCGNSAGDASKERLAKMAGGKLSDVVAVSGIVSVDGTPAEGVRLNLHPKSGGPSITQCVTDASGAYCWTTNVTCDGLPPGEYTIVFRRFGKKEKGPDLFKGRYSNPQKSEYELVVEAGKPQKDVEYALKSK